MFLHCITHNNIPDTGLTINISINAAVVTMTTVFIFVECSVIVNQTKHIKFGYEWDDANMISMDGYNI